MTYYETLGVPRDADAATVRKAYRRKAIKAHPDRGGDVKKMQALQEAYDCLKDPARRTAYDAGDETSELQLVHEAENVIEVMFAEMMDEKPSAVLNVVLSIRDRLMNGDVVLESGIRGQEAIRKKLLRWQGRIVRREDGLNVFEKVIEKRIEDATESLNSKRRAKRIGLLAIDMLAMYSDKGTPLGSEGEMRLRWSDATTGVNL